MTKSIMLVGVGGQGTILASKLLTTGLMNAGYDVKMSEIHGMSQRGGSVSSQVRYGEKVYSPVIEIGGADILVSFEKMEALRWLEYLKPEGKIVVNNYRIDSIPVLTGKAIYKEKEIEDELNRLNATIINAADKAKELGNSKVMNIILLGALVKSMSLEDIDWESIIRENIKEKFVDINLQAFKKGMEMVSEEAVTYFFALAMAQADYRLAEENVASSDTLYSIGLQRHKIAAISRADLLTLQLDKVNAHNTLQNAQIALKRAMFSLASFLNLDKNTVIELDIPGRPTGKMIPVDDALMRAKENNPTFLEQRQNVLEAEQNVDKTKKESRFNASFNASVGFNQVADKLGDAYRHPLQQDLVSVSVSIPLIDWGVRKGKYNMARNNLNVVRIAARQEELSVEEEVIMTVNDFNIQQSLIASAEEALDLAVMAYEQTRQRFIIGKADVNSLTLSLNRQQEAQKNYISALQNYWLNYYKIRKLTLHDFESGFSLADKFDFNTGIYR